MIKEIPILFSTPMVQAILEGRKTQTRRLIKEKLQPVRDEIILGRRLVKPSGWPLMMTTAGIDYRHWKANQKLKFQKLWGEINGAESWQANPWLWAINFKVLSTTGKPDLKQ